MILPGLISVAFYRRRPSRTLIGLGLVPTIVLSALLGYVSPSGPVGQAGSVVIAIVGAVALYFGILWYLSSHQRPTSPPPPEETL